MVIGINIVVIVVVVVVVVVVIVVVDICGRLVVCGFAVIFPSLGILACR